MDNLVAYIKKNLNVRIGRKDDIIAVSFDSPYPVETAEIVNAVVQSYVNYYSTHKHNTVSEVLRILKKRLNATRNCQTNLRSFWNLLTPMPK